jgi:hypothetical protein
MKFVAIDPRDCTVKMMAAKDLNDLYNIVGLVKNQVDFACIHHSGEWSLNIIVAEFGLFKPVEQGKYFSLGGQLLEGGAIIFRADEAGETVDMVAIPPVMFYRSHVEVEQAIARGEVARPQMSVNGEVIWTWPEERPNLMGD